MRLGVAIVFMLILIAGAVIEAQSKHKSQRVCATVKLPHDGQVVTKWIQGYRVRIDRP